MLVCHVDYLQTPKPKTLQVFYINQETEYLNSFLISAFT